MVLAGVDVGRDLRECDPNFITNSSRENMFPADGSSEVRSLDAVTVHRKSLTLKWLLKDHPAWWSVIGGCPVIKGMNYKIGDLGSAGF